MGGMWLSTEQIASLMNVPAGGNGGGNGKGGKPPTPEGGKPGDWKCPSCGDLVFASKMACKMCGTPKPGMMGGGCGGGNPMAAMMAMMGGGQGCGGGCGFGGGGNVGKGGDAMMMQMMMNMMGGNGGKGATPPGGKPGDWTCPNCGDLVFASKVACKMCGTPKTALTGGPTTPLSGKPGDWNCPSCNQMNFSKNKACKQCNKPIPTGVGRFGARPGDWICGGCGDFVFANKEQCTQCGSAKSAMSEAAVPAAMSTSQVLASGQGKPGDWICPAPGCQNVVFSRKSSCEKCGTANTGVQRIGMKPGDWICANCGDLVYASKANCKMCGTPKAAGDGTPPGFQKTAMMLGGATKKHGFSPY